MSYADPRITPTPSVEDLAEKLDRAESVAHDMTAVIAAKCEQERKLSEQIAHVISTMLEIDTSDMELPELVAALIDVARIEKASAQVANMEPEEAPGVFMVLDSNGRITGPSHDTAKKAREHVELLAAQRADHRFVVARRVAICSTSVAVDWKED